MAHPMEPSRKGLRQDWRTVKSAEKIVLVKLYHYPAVRYIEIAYRKRWQHIGSAPQI
jgi:hypothetical protein